jgi:ABC-2 type transport system ATP-binding protein
VILASHLLDEVEKVCTHVAILKKGELLTAGDISGTLSKEGQTPATGDTPKPKETAMIEVVADDLENLADVLKTLDGVLDINILDGVVTIAYYTDELTLQQVNKHCFDNGVVVSRLTVKSKNLESKFLELTK